MAEHIINTMGQGQDDPCQGLKRLSAPDFIANPIKTPFVLWLDGHDDVDALIPYLPTLQHIAIAFPHFADGRGFSLARLLREEGFQGHLRATGHITPDQFRHVMAMGFDDIALSPDLASRYGGKAWQDTARLTLPDYQARVGQPPQK